MLLPLLRTLALTLPLLLPLASASPVSPPLPVILWHGLGDSSDADGLASVATLLDTLYPGIHVHIISLGADGPSDRTASFLGNTTSQLSDACAALAADPLLAAAAGRVDALGFSQGGLFLRGLVQRCPAIAVRSLVTFGSPHNGIVELPACGAWDLVCRGAERAFEANRWSAWVQGNLVPAQYFRETDEVTGLGGKAYLNHSGLLADLNNEREAKRDEYRDRIGALDALALYLFTEDVTVVPKETGWFADVNLTSGEVTDLRDRALYTEDWIGLKALDEKGGLVFGTVEGGHMRLTEAVLRDAFKTFFGPERKEKKTPSLWSALTNKVWQDVSLVGGDR